jgi:hypothetical protein
VATEETEGRFIFDVDNHQWDIPQFFLLQGNGFFDKLLQEQTYGHYLRLVKVLGGDNG